MINKISLQKKPSIYSFMYGTVHICDHPVYDKCTLFKMGEKDLAVIQQRFDQKTKLTTKKSTGNVF